MEVEFLISILNLGEAESDENDDSHLKMFLRFEPAIVAE